MTERPGCPPSVFGARHRAPRRRPPRRGPILQAGSRPGGSVGCAGGRRSPIPIAARTATVRRRAKPRSAGAAFSCRACGPAGSTARRVPSRASPTPPTAIPSTPAPWGRPRAASRRASTAARSTPCPPAEASGRSRSAACRAASWRSRSAQVPRRVRGRRQAASSPPGTRILMDEPGACCGARRVLDAPANARPAFPASRRPQAA
jgi:hypothetical protein